jgi:thiamine-phosphate pyrophosphorylase
MIRGFYGMVDLPGDALPEHAVALGESLMEGGAQVLQLRCKHGNAREVLALAQALRVTTRARNVRLCVNDRVDLALLSEADFVHLGQDDLPLEAARELCTRRLRVGVSTHSLAQAMAARQGGADYIGFGPVFATASKERPDPVQGVTQLQEIVRAVAPLPVVAIGGITPDNVAGVAHAGAAAAAVIAAVNRATDVAAAARRVAAAFTA